MYGNVSFLHLQSPNYASQFSFNFADKLVVWIQDY